MSLDSYNRRFWARKARAGDPAPSYCLPDGTLDREAFQRDIDERRPHLEYIATNGTRGPRPVEELIQEIREGREEIAHIFAKYRPAPVTSPSPLPWLDQIPDRRDPQEWVYAMRPATGGLVKIGRSTDPLRRLAEIQNMSPTQLKLIWQAPLEQDREQFLHGCFANRRAHGEWFDFGNEDPVAAIEAALDARHQAALAGKTRRIAEELLIQNILAPSQHQEGASP